MISNQILDFLMGIEEPLIKTKDVVTMNPFQNPETVRIVKEFYGKYYADNNKRMALLGINPGRLGSGLTGIGFTDPVNLKEVCGIKNPFPQKHELSSKFIYDVIEAFGGATAFYSKIFISSTVPLGFTKNNINLNYYDEKQLENELIPYIKSSFQEQLPFLDRRVAFCIGKGENQKFLEKLNQDEGYFEKLEVLPHPRWVMQYRLKRKEEFIEQYLQVMEPYL